MNPYYLLDGQTLFWENNPCFDHGTNDVKWATMLEPLCGTPKKAGKWMFISVKPVPK